MIQPVLTYFNVAVGEIFSKTKYITITENTQITKTLIFSSTRGHSSVLCCMFFINANTGVRDIPVRRNVRFPLVLGSRKRSLSSG